MTGPLSAKIQLANLKLVAQGELELIGQFFSPEYLVHLTGQGIIGGHTVIRGFLELYQRAFTDLRVEVEIFMENDDRIAWQRTLEGTQSGAFKGFPSSGRKIVWRDVVTSVFRDGLIAEEWMISDLAEQLLLSRKRRDNGSAKPRVSRRSR